MSKTLFSLTGLLAMLLCACSNHQIQLYEFDELYTGKEDTYITDYVPSQNTSSNQQTTEETATEDDYVSNANRYEKPSPWSQNGWGNSGYGGYNYGAYNQFNCGASIMWMPYWAYSPAGFYTSPYAYYGYGMGYGNPYYNPYYNPYFIPNNSSSLGGYNDNSSGQVIYGARHPIASNSGINSSYTGGRFYLGQRRQDVLHKPDPIMTTSKPNEKIPSGKIQENIARAYKTADRSNYRGSEKPKNQNTNNRNQESSNSVRPQRDTPKAGDRPQQQSRSYERPQAPVRQSAPTRSTSPVKTGRP